MPSDIKILSTLGPASFQPSIIKKLDELGVDIFRINLSHTPSEEIERNIAHIISATNKPLCLDLEGAQIRSGCIKQNKVYFVEGSIVKIHPGTILGDEKNINFTPPFVFHELETGDLVSIDFDTLLLKVCERQEDYLLAEVVCGGEVGSNKAVSVDRFIHLPALSAKDISAVEIGLAYNVAYVALSFASNKGDIDELKQLTRGKMQIISKVESKKGLMHLEEIALNSDAILIDRGDLSRELSIEMIPLAQKRIIFLANRLGKPVYVATNFLETMIERKLPTRAEINDMINTLMDGANGLVLAAETAIGQNPLACVSMVQRVLNVYKDFQQGKSLEQMTAYNGHTLVLVGPHGGYLVNRFKNFDYEEKDPGYSKRIYVDEATILDCEQIATGGYSPLEGFMTREEIASVLEHCQLPGGVIWTLPIVLQVEETIAKDLIIGSTVALASEKDNQIYALLYLEDIYQFDFEQVVKKWYGTNDAHHPGVAALKAKGGVFLGGKIDLIRRKENRFGAYTLTPVQTRHIFEKRGWSSIVGFHTRNVIHRAHEYIQMKALHQYNLDGLFLHPIIGPKKSSDFNADIILESYSWMVNQFYPKGKVLLAAFLSYSRYAGPREAIFTALCRKNFGCTHFIVGRDHTGVGNFYSPDAAQHLFRQLGDIGIKPIFFNEVYYCPHCGQQVEDCVHGKESARHISGTQVRKMFLEKIQPPEWFMRPEIAELILRDLQREREVFVS